LTQKSACLDKGGSGRLYLLPLAFALSLLAGAGGALALNTLDEVKARGILLCGINQEVPALAERGADGRWHGLEVDFCRIVAAAVLKNADAVEFKAMPSPERFDALLAGDVDLVALERTRRAPLRGVRSAGLAFVDGQGLMVAKDSGIFNALGLDGARVCVLDDNRAKTDLERFAAGQGIALAVVAVPSDAGLVSAFSEDACDAVSANRLALAALAASVPRPVDILPDMLSRSQWSPFVREGDRGWLEVVRWSLFATIEAEEQGLTAATVAAQRGTSKDPRVLRFLGVEGDLGEQLGLDRAWAYRVVDQVGSYAEIYERHFGADTPMPLPRGPNDLWSNGGVLQAPAFQ
jgi:general L-amino acid transport system substrate-binding protein